jgi:hypothetical protein
MTKQNGVRAVRLPMTLFPSPVDTLQIKGNLKLQQKKYLDRKLMSDKFR